MTTPLTHEQIIKLNNASTENKAASVGSAISDTQKELGMATISGVDISTPVVINFTVGADATTALPIFNANCPYPFIVDEVKIECQAANASGTLTVLNGSTAITDAMICAVDKIVVRAGTIDDAQSTIALNGTLAVIANGAADRGKVTIYGRVVN